MMALTTATCGLLAFARPAAADPDPTWLLLAHQLRAEEAAVIYGRLDRRALNAARLLDASEGEDGVGAARRSELADALGRELEHVAGKLGWSRPATVLRPSGALSLGGLEPIGSQGDAESGLLALRAGGEATVWFRWGELALEPELRVGLVDADETVALGLDVAWLGWMAPRWELGVGLRPRHLGPGRQVSLTLSEHARPIPMATLAGHRRLPVDWLGTWSGELSVGVLDGARTDVSRPGLLLMDLRALPTPFVELGATRMSIFGGVDRPVPSLGQLILPTDPHVYDDPDQTLPDQDELASLDLRVHLPLGRWLGTNARGDAPLGLDRLEIYWQYGAEDVIARRLFGLPYPSLAGVANLFGGELAGGDWSFGVEGARILDDYFRWYVGHRVYHEGFTRDGRYMGHHAGSDALSWGGTLRWLPGPRGAELTLSQVRRVGVIEAIGPNILALSADERAWRIGVGVWRRAGPRWWQLRVEAERVENPDFVAGTRSDGLRFSLGL